MKDISANFDYDSTKFMQVLPHHSEFNDLASDHLHQKWYVVDQTSLIPMQSFPPQLLSRNSGEKVCRGEAWYHLSRAVV